MFAASDSDVLVVTVEVLCYTNDRVWDSWLVTEHWGLCYGE